MSARVTAPPTRRDWRERLASRPVPARLELLRSHSGLPGPRANLTLLDAAADLADPVFVTALVAADEEYLTACGAAGLGELAARDGDVRWRRALHELARDARWRVREGVAMALHRLGDADLADGGRRLADLAREWSAEPDPSVQRAVLAGVCEPRLLRSPDAAARAIAACERSTDLLREQDPATRRHPDWRTLRQALGYCWSVAVAADPAAGLPAFARLAGATGDPDVAWIVRTNSGKRRLATLLV